MEVVKKTGIKRAKGFLYYIDANGDIARTKTKTGVKKRAVAKKGTIKVTAKKAAAKKGLKLSFPNGVKLKKSNYHDNDERFIIMNGAKEHLEGKPFFYDRATEIAAALSKVKGKKLVKTPKKVAKKGAAVKQKKGRS